MWYLRIDGLEMVDEEAHESVGVAEGVGSAGALGRANDVWADHHCYVARVHFRYCLLLL